MIYIVVPILVIIFTAMMLSYTLSHPIKDNTDKFMIVLLTSSITIICTLWITLEVIL